MAHTDHARPARDPLVRLYLRFDAEQDDWHALMTRKRKGATADLDMREQVRDLGSERDWYTLNTVGVHLPVGEPYAEWEIELLGARIHEHKVVHSTHTHGYEVDFDPYYLDRASTVTRTQIVPVIENTPINTWAQRFADQAARKAARKERKRKEALEARKRTLTDEERREILRRESIGLLGFSRL